MAIHYTYPLPGGGEVDFIAECSFDPFYECLVIDEIIVDGDDLLTSADEAERKRGEEIAQWAYSEEDFRQWADDEDLHHTLPKMI